MNFPRFITVEGYRIRVDAIEAYYYERPYTLVVQLYGGKRFVFSRTTVGDFEDRLATTGLAEVTR